MNFFHFTGGGAVIDKNSHPPPHLLSEQEQREESHFNHLKFQLQNPSLSLQDLVLHIRDVGLLLEVQPSIATTLPPSYTPLAPHKHISHPPLSLQIISFLTEILLKTTSPIVRFIVVQQLLKSSHHLNHLFMLYNDSSEALSRHTQQLASSLFESLTHKDDQVRLYGLKICSLCGGFIAKQPSLLLEMLKGACSSDYQLQVVSWRKNAEKMPSVDVLEGGILRKIDEEEGISSFFDLEDPAGLSIRDASFVCLRESLRWMGNESVELLLRKCWHFIWVKKEENRVLPIGGTISFLCFLGGLDFLCVDLCVIALRMVWCIFTKALQSIVYLSAHGTTEDRRFSSSSSNREEKNDILLEEAISLCRVCLKVSTDLTLERWDLKPLQLFYLKTLMQTTEFFQQKLCYDSVEPGLKTVNSQLINVKWGEMRSLSTWCIYRLAAAGLLRLQTPESSFSYVLADFKHQEKQRGESEFEEGEFDQEKFFSEISWEEILSWSDGCFRAGDAAVRSFLSLLNYCLSWKNLPSLLLHTRFLTKILKKSQFSASSESASADQHFLNEHAENRMCVPPAGSRTYDISSSFSSVALPAGDSAANLHSISKIPPVGASDSVETAKFLHPPDVKIFQKNEESSEKVVDCVLEKKGSSVDCTPNESEFLTTTAIRDDIADSSLNKTFSSDEFEVSKLHTPFLLPCESISSPALEGIEESSENDRESIASDDKEEGEISEDDEEDDDNKFYEGISSSGRGGNSSKPFERNPRRGVSALHTEHNLFFDKKKFKKKRNVIPSGEAGEDSKPLDATSLPPSTGISMSKSSQDSSPQGGLRGNFSLVHSVSHDSHTHPPHTPSSTQENALQGILPAAETSTAMFKQAAQGEDSSKDIFFGLSQEKVNPMVVTHTFEPVSYTFETAAHTFEPLAHAFEARIHGLEPLLDTFEPPLTPILEQPLTHTLEPPLTHTLQPPLTREALLHFSHISHIPQLNDQLFTPTSSYTHTPTPNATSKSVQETSKSLLNSSASGFFIESPPPKQLEPHFANLPPHFLPEKPCTHQEEAMIKMVGGAVIHHHPPPSLLNNPPNNRFGISGRFDSLKSVNPAFPENTVSPFLSLPISTYLDAFRADEADKKMNFLIEKTSNLPTSPYNTLETHTPAASPFAIVRRPQTEHEGLKVVERNKYTTHEAAQPLQLFQPNPLIGNLGVHTASEQQADTSVYSDNPYDNQVFIPQSVHLPCYSPNSLFPPPPSMAFNQLRDGASLVGKAANLHADNQLSSCVRENEMLRDEDSDLVMGRWQPSDISILSQGSSGSLSSVSLSSQSHSSFGSKTASIPSDYVMMRGGKTLLEMMDKQADIIKALGMQSNSSSSSSSFSSSSSSFPSYLRENASSRDTENVGREGFSHPLAFMQHTHPMIESEAVLKANPEGLSDAPSFFKGESLCEADEDGSLMGGCMSGREAEGLASLEIGGFRAEEEEGEFSPIVSPSSPPLCSNEELLTANLSLDKSHYLQEEDSQKLGQSGVASSSLLDSMKRMKLSVGESQLAFVSHTLESSSFWAPASLTEKGAAISESKTAGKLPSLKSLSLQTLHQDLQADGYRLLENDSNKENHVEKRERNTHTGSFSCDEEEVIVNFAAIEFTFLSTLEPFITDSRLRKIECAFRCIMKVFGSAASSSFFASTLPASSSGAFSSSFPSSSSSFPSSSSSFPSSSSSFPSSSSSFPSSSSSFPSSSSSFPSSSSSFPSSSSSFPSSSSSFPSSTSSEIQNTHKSNEGRVYLKCSGEHDSHTAGITELYGGTRITSYLTVSQAHYIQIGRAALPGGNLGEALHGDVNYQTENQLKAVCSLENQGGSSTYYYFNSLEEACVSGFSSVAKSGKGLLIDNSGLEASLDSLIERLLSLPTGEGRARVEMNLFTLIIASQLVCRYPQYLMVKDDEEEKMVCTLLWSYKNRSITEESNHQEDQRSPIFPLSIEETGGLSDYLKISSKFLEFSLKIIWRFFGMLESAILSQKPQSSNVCAAAGSLKEQEERDILHGEMKELWVGGRKMKKSFEGGRDFAQERGFEEFGSLNGREAELGSSHTHLSNDDTHFPRVTTKTYFESVNEEEKIFSLSFFDNCRRYSLDNHVFKRLCFLWFGNFVLCLLQRKLDFLIVDIIRLITSRQQRLLSAICSSISSVKTLQSIELESSLFALRAILSTLLLALRLSFQPSSISKNRDFPPNPCPTMPCVRKPADGGFISHTLKTLINYYPFQHSSLALIFNLQILFNHLNCFCFPVCGAHTEDFFEDALVARESTKKAVSELITNKILPFLGKSKKPYPNLQNSAKRLAFLHQNEHENILQEAEKEEEKEVYAEESRNLPSLNLEKASLRLREDDSIFYNEGVISESIYSFTSKKPQKDMEMKNLVVEDLLHAELMKSPSSLSLWVVYKLGVFCEVSSLHQASNAVFACLSSKTINSASHAWMNFLVYFTKFNALLASGEYTPYEVNEVRSAALKYAKLFKHCQNLDFRNPLPLAVEFMLLKDHLFNDLMSLRALLIDISFDFFSVEEASLLQAIERLYCFRKSFWFHSKCFFSLSKMSASLSLTSRNMFGVYKNLSFAAYAVCTFIHLRLLMRGRGIPMILHRIHRSEAELLNSSWKDGYADAYGINPLDDTDEKSHRQKSCITGFSDNLQSSVQKNYKEMLLLESQGLSKQGVYHRIPPHLMRNSSRNENVTIIPKKRPSNPPRKSASNHLSDMQNPLLSSQKTKLFSVSQRRRFAFSTATTAEAESSEQSHTYEKAGYKEKNLDFSRFQPRRLHASLSEAEAIESLQAADRISPAENALLGSRGLTESASSLDKGASLAFPLIEEPSSNSTPRTIDEGHSLLASLVSSEANEFNLLPIWLSCSNQWGPQRARAIHHSRYKRRATSFSGVKPASHEENDAYKDGLNQRGGEYPGFPKNARNPKNPGNPGSFKELACQFSLHRDSLLSKAFPAVYLALEGTFVVNTKGLDPETADSVDLQAYNAPFDDGEGAYVKGILLEKFIAIISHWLSVSWPIPPRALNSASLPWFSVEAKVLDSLGEVFPEDPWCSHEARQRVLHTIKFSGILMGYTIKSFDACEFALLQISLYDEEESEFEEVRRRFFTNLDSSLGYYGERKNKVLLRREVAVNKGAFSLTETMSECSIELLRKLFIEALPLDKRKNRTGSPSFASITF